jgi:hypothetical protein
MPRVLDRGALRPEDTVTEPDSLAEYLNRELAHSYTETVEAVTPCLVKTVSYVEVPHELLVDSGGHTCDATCLALYGNAYVRIPGPPPWRTRARYALRRARWRLARIGGLRLVHKDRIDQDRDDN